MAKRYPGSLRLTGFRTPIPAALYLWPPLPGATNRGRSYTGQPAAELHLPGSPPLLEAVLGELFSHGARPARPGEFTLRAFLAGRIDLVQAEAVLGVIDADDQPRLKTALSQLAGGVSGRIDAVRSDLLNLLADLEAGLDFVEEDIEFVSRDELLARIASAGDALAALLAQTSARMLSTGRRSVVIAGLPNAGKSTLFNALVGRESALVSEVSGTTRDYLAAECDWNGTAINLIDTAGWEQPGDQLTAAAQSQRARQLEQADLVLWCTAANLEAAEQAEDLRSRQELFESGCPLLHVRTKIDLAGASVVRGSPDRHVVRGSPDRRVVRGSPDPACAPTAGLPVFGRPAVGRVARSGDRAATEGDRATTKGDRAATADVSVSVTERIGLEDLIARAAGELSRDANEGQELVGTTAARCRESLESAAAALESAHSAGSNGGGDEIIAVDLHESLEHLGRIVGSVYTDDILDRVFSRFCIGK